MSKAVSAKGKAKSEIPGPVPGTRLTEEYVRQIGRLAYWPDAAITDGKWTPPPVERAK